MKLENKLSVGLLTVVLLLAGCNEVSNAAPAAQKSVTQEIVTEESLGLRKTDLYSEADTTGDKTTYATSAAGESKKIPRAFQDAPPMIPHNTEGMFPITASNNACMGCHMPEVAKDMGATPIPSSHFTDFRPESIAIKGINTSNEKMTNISINVKKKLVGARFSCTQCHASQSTGDLVVKSTFEPVFSDKDGATKSSWSGSRFTDALDTFN